MNVIYLREPSVVRFNGLGLILFFSVGNEMQMGVEIAESLIAFCEDHGLDPKEIREVINNVLADHSTILQ